MRVGRSMRAAIGGAVCIFLAGCTIERRTDRAVASQPSDPISSEFLRPWGAAAPPAGVRSGDLVWIWAMAGTVPGSVPARVVEGGIASETRQALANVGAVLAEAGGTLRDVGQCSVFLADGAERGAMEAAYVEFFPAPPQRVAVAMDGLATGARVEVECTAVLPSTR